MKYAEELTRAMTWLGEKEDTFFLGQAVEYKGTAMTGTLKDVPKDRLLELPVCEDMQMGMSFGMSMDGTFPISIYPRGNFLLLASNQLVNHIDKCHAMTGNHANIIIRTSIGSQRPIHPQHQHVADFTDAFRLMCPMINIVKLDEPEEIFPAYEKAYDEGGPTILVEWGDYYGEK